MTVSPTQRSLARLRAEGWTAEVVEHRVPRTNVTRDLFGFVDILAVRGRIECSTCDLGWVQESELNHTSGHTFHRCHVCQGSLSDPAAATLAVQCTTSGNLAARIRKIADHPNLPTLREAGWQIEAWGWSYSKREKRWVCRVVDVS